MNSTTILAGVLSCLALMLAITHSWALSGPTADGQQHHLLFEHPAVVPSNKYISAYESDDAGNEESNEHMFEKRRFNAWAGKRSMVGKRRFNSWAGRR